MQRAVTVAVTGAVTLAVQGAELGRTTHGSQRSHGSPPAVNGSVAVSHGGRLPTEKCATLHAY